MATADLDVIKDIPGYKVILKVVLKSQIQQLVELLATGTDEESVFLTASVSDGTLSHLGSDSGKGFLEGHEDIKSQFLGFCLKNHHKKKQEKERVEEAVKQTAQLLPRYPGQAGIRGRRGRPALPLQRHPFRTPGTRHEPYPVSRPVRVQSPSNLNNPVRTVTKLKPAASAASITNETIKIEPLSDENTRLSASDDIAGKLTSANATLSVSSSPHSLNPSSPRSSTEMKSEQISPDKRDNAKVSQPYPSTSTDTVSEQSADDNSAVELSGLNSRLSSGAGTDNTGDISGADNEGNVDSKSHTTLDPNVNVKVEAISEADMELEITGVEMGAGMYSGEQDYGWNPDEQGTAGYDMSGATGTDGDMAGSNQGYNKLGPSEGGLCKICGASFRSRSGLRDHEMRHDNNARYTCCGKGFFSRANLMRHRCSTHGAVKHHSCDVCGSKFATKSDMTSHKRVHAAKRLSCGVCGKQMTRMTVYKDHMANHAGEKQHECHCGKRFTYQPCLSRHKTSCKKQ